MSDSWFKADVSFFCPNCQKVSVEQIIAAADKHNPDAVARAVREAISPLTCQWCKKVAPEGIKVQLGMNDFTPEELAKVKFIKGPSIKPS